MSIVIIMPNRDTTELCTQLKLLDPTLNVEVWPHVKDNSACEFAIVWKHPHGCLSEFPHLKAVCSYGAGVDFIIEDEKLPTHLPIARIIDDALASQMSEYLLATVLMKKRHLLGYYLSQQNTLWQPLPLTEDKCNKIMILGLGVLGQHAAKQFSLCGFDVSGFSKNPKNLTFARTYHDYTELHGALKSMDFLINLLPSTPDTQAFVNAQLLQSVKKGCFFINAGRGATVNDQDLMDALDHELLSGVCLDVFKAEPLAKEHPFWNHPKVIITPHIASLTDPVSVAGQLYQQYMRVKSNQPLMNEVDFVQGY